MIVKITPKALNGSVRAPASKSYAHRYVISAFLAGKGGLVCNAGTSKDVDATVGALNALGGSIERHADDIGGFCERKKVPDAVVDCKESGSTLRFLFPLAPALGISARFTGSERLMERPIGELAKCLEANGATVDGHSVSGKLRPGSYEIEAGVSSQYITGLLFALPLLEGESKIILKGKAVSLGYLEITLDVLRRFGIEIIRESYGFRIPGRQRYVPPADMEVEGDYSGAAFMLASGAIGGSVTVSNLNLGSSQGDREILSVLRKFGASVSVNGNCVTVENAGLNAISHDCENIPDLVQIISVVASFARGTTELKNVSRLKIKESDRVQAIIDMLTRAGIFAEERDGNLYVTGGDPHGAEFHGGNDHRTVMSEVILATHATGESIVIGAEAVSKSYPEFFLDFSILGGKSDVVI